LTYGYNSLPILEKDQKFIEYIKSGLLIVDTNKGTVTNSRTNRIIGHNSEKQPTLKMIILSDRGKTYSITRGRLVWLAQHGPIKDGLYIVHKKDSLDDSINNLELKERGEITSISKKISTKRGSKKLTPKDVQEIRYLRTKNWTYQSLGTKYGVNKITVLSLVLHKTWPYVKGFDLINKEELDKLSKPVVQPKIRVRIAPTPKQKISLETFVKNKTKEYPKTCESIRKVFENNANYSTAKLHMKIMELKPKIDTKSLSLVIKYYKSYYTNLISKG
jgi:hypothetical protein